MLSPFAASVLTTYGVPVFRFVAPAFALFGHTTKLGADMTKLMPLAGYSRNQWPRARHCHVPVRVRPPELLVHVSRTLGFRFLVRIEKHAHDLRKYV